MAAGTMPVGGRQHVFEKLASILGLVAAPLMLLGLSACGRGAGKTSEPTCPTEPIDAADSSTTPDPSCVVRATEINGNGSRIQTWTGSYDAAATQSGGVWWHLQLPRHSAVHGRRRPDLGQRRSGLSSGDGCYRNTPHFAISGTMTMTR